MALYHGEQIKIIDNDFVDERIRINDVFAPPYIPGRKRVIYRCEICGYNFMTGNAIPAKYRKICKCHQFLYTCGWCHQEFTISRLSDFAGSDNHERFCSKNCALQSKNRSESQINAVVEMNLGRVKKNLAQKQICKRCGKPFHSIFPMEICNGCIVTETNVKTNQLEQTCEECGNIFHSPFHMKICQICNPMLSFGKADVMDEFCKKCGKITHHVGKRCLICNPIHNFILYSNCEKCGKITPHICKNEHGFYCQVCADEKIWCEKCGRWETVKFNKRQNHWIHWGTITKQWINNHLEEFNRMSDRIDGLQETKGVSGVYCWYLNDTPFYVGISSNIYVRSMNHIMEMHESPEYWGNVVNLNDIGIRLEILQEEGNRDAMRQLEIEWIDALKLL